MLTNWTKPHKAQTKTIEVKRGFYTLVSTGNTSIPYRLVIGTTHVNLYRNRQPNRNHILWGYLPGESKATYFTELCSMSIREIAGL